MTSPILASFSVSFRWRTFEENHGVALLYSNTTTEVREGSFPQPQIETGHNAVERYSHTIQTIILFCLKGGSFKTGATPSFPVILLLDSEPIIRFLRRNSIQRVSKWIHRGHGCDGTRTWATISCSESASFLLAVPLLVPHHR